MTVSTAFRGALGLNNTAQESWLTYVDDAGTQQTDLMTREPPPPGSGSNGGVSAMWSRFRNDPATPDGSNVTVQGFAVAAPGLQRMLHVTQS